jgi:hypothetical protein
MRITQFIEWLFRTPFLWMTLLGIVSSRSIKRYMTTISLPYAPLIEENEDKTGGQLVLSFLLGAIGSVFLFYTSTVPSLTILISIWLVASLFMMAQKDSVALLSTAFIIGAILFFIGNRELGRITIRYCGIYQLIIGIIFLIEKKGTYPVMQQDKEGNVFGQHIYKRVWLFPAVTFSISNIESFIYILLVMLLISTIKINRENVRNYFKKQGLFMTITGVMTLAVSFIYVDIVYIILLFVVLPSCIIIWIVLQTKFNKNNSYYFVAKNDGLQVFYIYDNSPASIMKLEIGDIIKSINGRRIITENALSVVLDEYPPFIWLEIQRGKQNFEVEYQNYKKGINSLGAVYTSRNSSKFEVYPNRSNLINYLFKSSSIFKD